MKFNLTISELKSAEKSVYSQAGQDGVLEAIFYQIWNSNKIFIDIGSRDGEEISNTANLRLNKRWVGLLIDVNPLSGIVNQEFVTAANINSIFEKYNIHKEVDLLCMDIDGNEYWIFNAIEIRPRVIVIEYNSKFNNDESYAIEYNPEHKWEGDDYYGASLLALKKLGEQKGYTLVYVVGELDAFFLRNDLLSKSYVPPTLDELLPAPIIAHEKVSDKKWIKI